MFKGILPSKRVASNADFTMVTTLDTTVNDKENQPGASKSKSNRPATTATKSFMQAYEKKKKLESAEAECAIGPATNQAFDKLLVRCRADSMRRS